MRNRRVALAVIALLLAVGALRHPSANISIIAHQPSDPAPREMRAAVDLGVMAFNLFITWTGRPFLG